MYKYIEETKNDPKYHEIICYYQEYYLQEGWSAFFNVLRMVLCFVFVSCVLLHDRNSEEFASIMVTRPAVLLLLTIANSLMKRYPVILEYIFPMIMILFSIIFTFENLKQKDAKFYDLWHFYHLLSFMVTIVH